MSEKLQNFFREHPKAALAFSGGTDSAYLLCAGLQAGADIRAYYVKSQFQPLFELEDARRLARELKIKLHEISLDILSVPQIKRNPPDRCYHCKLAIFQALIRQADKDGYPLVIDGTNASDLPAERPGMNALNELGVRSPLREAGITKPEVRSLSKSQNLFTWNKPAYACLATRIVSGESITEHSLRQVELSEQALADLGFCDFRIRVSGNTARLQVRAEQMDQVLKHRKSILKILTPCYSSISLDLAAR